LIGHFAFSLARSFFSSSLTSTSSFSLLSLTHPTQTERLLAVALTPEKKKKTSSTALLKTAPPPPSPLAARLAAFLPELAAANAAFAAAPSGSDFDIESVREGEAHVEMEVACGVIDLKDEGAVRAAEAAVARGGGAGGGGIEGGEGEGGVVDAAALAAAVAAAAEASSSSDDDSSSEEDEESEGGGEEAEGGKEGAKAGTKKNRKSGRKRRLAPGIQEL